MATWKTAGEIAERYVVGEERLVAYGRRGNLPFRRVEGGELLFEEHAVARIFRSRSGTMTSSGASESANVGFGILGSARMGQRPHAARWTGREERRRALRFTRPPLVERRKASG